MGAQGDQEKPDVPPGRQQATRLHRWRMAAAEYLDAPPAHAFQARLASSYPESASRNARRFSAGVACVLNTLLPHTSTFAPAAAHCATFPVFTPPSIITSAW